MKNYSKNLKVARESFLGGVEKSLEWKGTYIASAVVGVAKGGLDIGGIAKHAGLFIVQNAILSGTLHMGLDYNEIKDANKED